MHATGSEDSIPCRTHISLIFKLSTALLPDSVVDAPPLIDLLLAEAKHFLEEFQSRMLLPPEAAAVIQEIT